MAKAKHYIGIPFRITFPSGQCALDAVKDTSAHSYLEKERKK
jgi:hypothetical protein